MKWPRFTSLPLVFILLFLAACAPRAYKSLRPASGDAECVLKFKPDIARALYRTQVDVVGNHLSGILIIKQMPDSSLRLVFSNEAGYKFFDFEFSASGDFTVHSIIKKMDKEAVKQTLRKDFGLVLMNTLKKSTGKSFIGGVERYTVFESGEDFFYYITDANCAELLRMERGSKTKKIVEAKRGILKNGIPETIDIHHFNFNFDIKLNRIYDDAEE